jgi:hypothetical protein
LRGGIATAIALAVALPFNALAAEPTPDPPEPYLTGTVGVGWKSGSEMYFGRIDRSDLRLRFEMHL